MQRPRSLLTRSPRQLRLGLSTSLWRPKLRSFRSRPHPSRSAAGSSLQRSPASARVLRLASSSLVVRARLHSPPAQSRERSAPHRLPPRVRLRQYPRGHRNRPAGRDVWTFLPPRRSLHINSWFRVGEMMRLSSTWPASPALPLRVRCRRLSAAAIPGRSSRQIGARSFTSVRSPAVCGRGPWMAAATAP